MGVKVLEMFDPTRFSLVRISIRDLVTDRILSKEFLGSKSDSHSLGKIKGSVYPATAFRN